MEIADCIYSATDTHPAIMDLVKSGLIGAYVNSILAADGSLTSERTGYTFTWFPSGEISTINTTHILFGQDLNYIYLFTSLLENRYDRHYVHEILHCGHSFDI